MKEVLICRCGIAPGDGEKTNKFNSYNGANTGIGNMLCKNIDISDCVNTLKKRGRFSVCQRCDGISDTAIAWLAR